MSGQSSCAEILWHLADLRKQVTDLRKWHAEAQPALGSYATRESLIDSG